MDEPKSNELMDIKSVLVHTQLEESTLSRLISRNEVSLPLHLSNGNVLGWYRDEIEDWLNDPRRIRA